MLWSLIAQVTPKAGSADAGEATSEIASFIGKVLTTVPMWFAAAGLLIVTFLLAKIVKAKVENKIIDKGIEEEHKEIPILAGRAAYAGVVTIGVTASLKVAGIDITSIVAAVAFGLGFALKDLIMNFLAGIMVLLSHHFSIGDYIQINSTIGQIIEIQSRSTILRAFDGTKIVVPNAELFNSQVTSYTSNPFRRFEIGVGVDYRSDLRKVVQLCLDAMKETPGVLAQPAPSVLMQDFGDSAITFTVKAWCGSRSGFKKIRSEVMHRIKQKFDENNIVIPWPIRTIAYDKEQAPTIQPSQSPVQVLEPVQLKQELDAHEEAQAQVDSSLHAEMQAVAETSAAE